MKQEHKEQKPHVNVPEIDSRQITPIWLTDAWNGPIAGLCTFQEKFYYFATKSNLSKPVSRRQYLLYPLTDSETQEFQEQHREFCRLVGDHCDFNPDWTLANAPHKPTWKQFFEKHPAQPKKQPLQATTPEFRFFIPERKRKTAD